MKRCTCSQMDCHNLVCTGSAGVGAPSRAPITRQQRLNSERSFPRHKNNNILMALLTLASLQTVCSFLFINPTPQDRISFHQSRLALTTEQDNERVRNIRFASPLLEEGYPRVVQEFQNGTITNKPLLLYLPGFDGTWVAPFLQFPELSTIFDVRCLTIGMDDRSTFQELKEDVIDYIYKQVQLDNATDRNNDATIMETNVTEDKQKGGNFFTNLFGGKQDDGPRSLYLMGESFGGILASEVAITLLKERKLSNLKGLAVINAATCYDRSRFASEAIKIARLPSFLYPFGLLTMIPLFTDEHAFPQLLLMLQSKALPSVIDSEEREAFMGRVAFSLPQKLKYMPQETLEWRLTQWLEEGCAVVASRLEEFASLNNFRTLIIAGEKDMTLPSIAEAERLSNILPNCHVHVVEGAGHANTCGSRVDLAALMRGRYEELKNRGKRGSRFGRTSMKPDAAKRTGNYYGMQPRYNGKEEGLSPLLYWSKRLWTRPPKEFK